MGRRSSSRARARRANARAAEDAARAKAAQAPANDNPALVRLRAVADERFARLHPARAAQERELTEQRRRLLQSYGHKVHGTPETHAAAGGQRPGALSRLYVSGTLTIHQLGWAEEIAAQHRRIGADVSVRTASIETRVDRSRMGDEAFFESLGPAGAETK